MEPLTISLFIVMFTSFCEGKFVFLSPDDPSYSVAKINGAKKFTQSTKSIHLLAFLMGKLSFFIDNIKAHNS